VAGTFSTEKDDQSGLADLAVRPLGNHRLTLFGDLELPKGISFTDAPWSAGAMMEVVDGVKLVGRYFEDESFALSLAYSFGGGVKSGRLRGTASPRFDKNNDHLYTNYGVRIGFAERNVIGAYLQKNRYYLHMNLKGPVVHSRYKFFDDGLTLKNVLEVLEDAKNDSRVKGVAVNLSGSQMSWGTAWEIREKLAELQKDGKHVVVFVDEVYTTTYHLASVADRIVMDPEGLMFLSGYVMGRTYMPNLLDKLGLGFDEWRFLKYKSAAESLSRHSMSEADREQRQAITDELYNTVRNNVAKSRGVSPSTFDKWIDEITLFTSAAAMREGMVDALGRWEDVKDIIAKLEESKKSYVGARSLAGYFFKSKRWSEPPRVALVYALGECAMDSGIKARRLEKIFQGIRDDRRVKAVVFRVNSPGGSALASDVVVRALKKCSEKKPVVVSQADVAASGGYWISMYADEIVAQPATITGSIGVIGGWVWDNGMGEKIGIEGDHVKRGEHADLLFGLRLPLIGIRVPHRPLTTEERDRIMSEMETFYNGFVQKVATGRNMEAEAVEKVAQGRVWTGIQGKEVGLIDRIGGLEVALDVARERAGISPSEEVKVVEYGLKGWFDLGELNPFPFSKMWREPENREEFDPCVAGFAGFVGYLDRYELLYIREFMKNNGKPMCLIPPDYLPREAKSFSE
jgi:protease-4